MRECLGPDSEPGEYFYVVVVVKSGEANAQRVFMNRTSRANDSCFLSPVVALVRALSLSPLSPSPFASRSEAILDANRVRGVSGTELR